MQCMPWIELTVSDRLTADEIIRPHHNHNSNSRIGTPSTPPLITKMSSNTDNTDTKTNPTTTDLYNQGLQTRRSVLGDAHVDHALSTNNTPFTRPLQDLITSHAWGAVWNRPGLDRKQRSLLNLGMLIALNRMPEFGIHVRGAVRNGVSELEIREAVVQTSVYCGAPAAMEGMRVAERVLGEMVERGEYVRTEL